MEEQQLGIYSQDRASRAVVLLAGALLMLLGNKDKPLLFEWVLLSVVRAVLCTSHCVKLSCFLRCWGEAVMLLRNKLLKKKIMRTFSASK